MRTFSTLLLAWGLCSTAFGQVVYEDFESGAIQTWNAINGTFNGVFANPDQTGINTSNNVGSYTKSDQHPFSLFLTELAAPMDLSVNNEFRIQINAPVASQVIMKLEGPSGGTEIIKNIANINTWIEYVFDFSGISGATDYNKIILFFDPGVMASDDTYLFDNIVAFPAGPCAGTVPDVTILDDFECQRNVTYGAGLFQLNVIPNPDPSGINTSASVGEYLDPEDLFSALVIDYHTAIDLSTLNVFKLKVWAPKTGNVLMKLEQGLSTSVEISIPITVTNQWVEVTADFSSQSAANHKRLAIFMNAGVLAGPNDIYYLDDITREAAPSGNILEDFEPTKLFWEPLAGNTAVHGTFTAPVANPNTGGINTSSNVGAYTKGSSNLSTLTGFFNGNLDLSTFSQLNIQVLPPTGATSLTMQLSSPSQGNKDINVPFTGTGAWETLSFDFSSFNNVNDFEGISLLFDPGSAGAGTYYFDNLELSGSTVDPCVGVVPIPNFLDDFECQRNIDYGAGANLLEVINNPDISTTNTSTRVGQYTDPLDAFSALVLEFGQPIDLSLYNQLLIKVWAPVTGPLMFKLEGGTSTAVEITIPVTTAGQWVQYQVDFSPHAAENHQKIAIFFNSGVVPTQQDVYYIDDLRMSRSAYTGCIATFENQDFTLKNWRYFANGSLEDTTFSVISNPDPSGINPSDSVGVFVEASDGLSFAGMFHPMDAPISLPNTNKTIRMKVWADQVATIVMKLERGRSGAAGSGDVPADYTTANQWQELTFNFSGVPDDALYDRITLIFGFDNIPTETQVYYFDDIIIADGICSTSSLEEKFQLVAMKVYPNPATGFVRVESNGSLNQLRMTNMMGQTVKQLDIPRIRNAEMDLTGLAPGVYFLAGYEDGRLVSRTKVVKE